LDLAFLPNLSSRSGLETIKKKAMLLT